ncbi:hypothetical protein NC981_25330, partial [Leptolyngbya sp. DQ-M1]|uniref:DUF6972 family protein n=1 Tax=Leptolyngbya sp. DQ-M1 TaxID=2933920 RepID=UPI003299A2FB
IYAYLKDISAPTNLIFRALNPLHRYLDDSLEEDAPKSLAFDAGRLLGNGAAILTGILEFQAGSSAAQAGAKLCFVGQGFGCIGGAPAIAIGTAVAGSGLITINAGTQSAAVSVDRLIEHLHVLFSKGASGTSGQNFPNPDSNRPTGKPPENSVHDKAYTESRHLENGSIVQKDLNRGKEAHIFNDPSALEALENKVWSEGVYQGQRQGELWHRWMYRSDTPIGKRIQEGRPNGDLYIVEIKGRYRSDGKFEYHLVPRSKPGVSDVN